MKGGFIMRLQLKKFIAVTLCLSVVLSSCTIRPGNHSKEALSQRPVSTVDTTGSDPQTFVITLLEGQTTAMVNGTEAQLSVAPFLQNGSFYYPLADVVRLIGGGFSQDGNTATIQLFGTTVKYTADDPEVIVNGTSYRNNYRLLRFAQDSDEESGAIPPQLLNGNLFVPHDLCPGGCPNFGLNVTREAPEARMLILGGYTDELGIEGIQLYDLFDQLPDETRAPFQSQGVAGTVLNYYIEMYLCEGTEVYVMRCPDGQEDVEGMNGKVAAIRLSGGTAYRTPRGLTVGDTAYRAWLLYGKCAFTSSFYYQVEDGYVSTIVFHTRYWGSSF